MEPHATLWLAVAMLADHATTNVVLKRGGTELNPLLARVVALWGADGMFLFKAGLFALAAYTATPATLLTMAATFAGASAWNTYQILR